jgi:hypothetical protein
MARITQLGYLGLGVSDLTAWEDYATQVLGLAVGARADDGTLFLRMDEYHHRCIVHPHGDDDVAYIGWEVADAHALEAVAAQVQAAGTPGLFRAFGEASVTGSVTTSPWVARRSPRANERWPGVPHALSAPAGLEGQLLPPAGTTTVGPSCTASWPARPKSYIPTRGAWVTGAS